MLRDAKHLFPRTRLATYIYNTSGRGPTSYHSAPDGSGTKDRSRTRTQTASDKEAAKKEKARRRCERNRRNRHRARERKRQKYPERYVQPKVQRGRSAWEKHSEENKNKNNRPNRPNRQQRSQDPDRSLWNALRAGKFYQLQGKFERRLCKAKSTKVEYRRLALLFHPDKVTDGNLCIYTNAMQALNAAREVVSFED